MVFDNNLPIFKSNPTATMAPLSVPAHKMAPGLTASSNASAVTPLVTLVLLLPRFSPRLTLLKADAAAAATPGELRMEVAGEAVDEPLGGGVAALMATIFSLGPQDFPVETLKTLINPGIGDIHAKAI